MSRVAATYTYEQLIEACDHNRQIAGSQIAAVKRRMALVDSAEEREGCLRELSRYRSDYLHWGDYVGYYRSLAAKDGPNAIPQISAIPAPPEREVGSDDDEGDAQKPG